MQKKQQDDKNLAKLQDKIDSALVDSRRIFICDAIDNDIAEDVIRKLWYLEMQDPEKPILLVINSPGGSVDAGFAIWDQAKLVSCPISTLITGLAASMGSVLALVAEKGRRFATQRSRIMIHQPALGGAIQGQATDLEIQAKEILKTKDLLINIYMEATGKSYEAIEKSIDRDTWMTAKEALTFGHIDKIVNSYKEVLA
jgi:ATP-dependent Clp protease, protease subunit